MSTDQLTNPINQCSDSLDSSKHLHLKPRFLSNCLDRSNSEGAAKTRSLKPLLIDQSDQPAIAFDKLKLLKRFCFTTNKRTHAVSQAFTIATPSSQRVAGGFSVQTCNPTFAAAMV